MYIGLHEKYPQMLMKLEFSRRIFKKYSNIKFHENPSGGSRVVPCEMTDITKLMVAFRNFADAPKISVQLFIPHGTTKRSLPKASTAIPHAAVLNESYIIA